MVANASTVELSPETSLIYTQRNLWAWQFKDAQCTGIGSVIARLELSEAVPKALTGEEEVRRQDEDTKV